MKYVVKKEYSPTLGNIAFYIYIDDAFVNMELTLANALDWIDNAIKGANYESEIVYEKEVNTGQVNEPD